MTKLELVVTDAGIESMTTRLVCVSDGRKAADLTHRTALACRLLHDAARSKEPVPDSVLPVNYLDSLLSTFTFRCTCGRVFIGPWEEARWEAVAHIERHHASETIRQDLDALENTIEALITPSPLYSYEQLAEQI